MAASRNPSRDFGDRRNNQHQNYERNRTFSSTTTEHFRNKLAHIGIEKDLRELLERKRLQKDQDKNFPNTADTSTEENIPRSQRKVRFEGATIPIRRSKSFTTESQESYPQTQRPYNNRFLKENNLEYPQPSRKPYSYRIKKSDFVDLYHPTNIKIQLKTDTGDRQCTVDSNVSISDVKCDIKKSRNVLKHTESKEKVDLHQTTQTEGKNVNVRGSGHYRGNFRRSFNKKNKENNKDSPRENEKDNDSAIANVEESLSKLSLTDKSEK